MKSGAWYEGLLVALIKDKEPASRSYRYAARLIEREFPPDRGATTIGFCSTEGDRLSSDVVLMQAYCLQSELDCEVLVIDARARDTGGGLSSRLGMQQRPGFAELLSEGLDRFDDCLQPSGVEGVTVLPRGGLSGSLLVTPRAALAALLQRARARFPYVLMQVGAVGADTRNLIIASAADAVMLVGLEEKTLMRRLQGDERRLRSGGIERVHVVLVSAHAG